MSNSKYQIYYIANREKCIAKTKRYYEKNKERILEKQKERKNKNRERIKKQRDEYRRKNREMLRLKQREYRSKNVEKVRESVRRSYNKHREKRIKDAKHYRLANPAKFKASLRKYYIKNRDKICAHARKMASADPKKRLEREREYIKKNRDKVYEKISRRNARKMALFHSESDSSIIAAIYKNSEKISSETGVRHSVDHIIPLAHGGWHHQDNLHVITGSMNSRKSDNPFWLSPHVGIKDWRDVPRHLWPLDLVAEYDALIAKHKGETIRWDLVAA